jgi:hypothetical protein
MKRVREPVSPPLPVAPDHPDRRILRYLLGFLIAGFERFQPSGVPTMTLPAEWLEDWSDEEYLYLETRITDDTSGLEIDMHLHNGVIFARIRHRGE